MAVSLKPLKDQVLVITGASSGIGLATAKAAAKRGAKLVLVSRNEEALTEAERGFDESGDRIAHFAADVADRDVLQRASDFAIEKFGGFDTWVNNAGVSIFGRLEEVSDEDSRRLFDTNFWGLVNGSLIAAAHLREKGGAIVNLGSEVSDMAVPLQGMYSASKHAVKGFTDALRMELEEAGAPISVTLIKPAAINTPFPHHAKNYLDREPQLPTPIYAPEEVANAILFAAAHPKRDIYVGGGSKMMSALNRTAPRLADTFGERTMDEQLSDEPPTRHRDGALYRAGTDGEIHGDSPHRVKGFSLYTRASLHPVLTGAIFGVLGFAAAAAGLAGSSRGGRY